MQEILDQYCTFLMTRQRVSANTYLAYRRDIEQFLTFRSTYKKDDLREPLIDFRDRLLQQGIGARSLARKLSALRSFFKYIHEYHPALLPLENPTTIIGHLPKIERRLPRVCSLDDMKRLLEAARLEQKECARAELICLLLYTAGLRVSELITLTFGAFHAAASRLTIVGKGGKMRVIPLVAPTCQALEAYKQTRASCKPSDLVFPQEGASRKAITRQTAWRLIKRVARRAGIATTVSPHVLRHTLATHSLEEGWDLRSLQMFLGHERIVTTEMYIHLDTRFVKSEYKKRHPRR